jgi:hypothetical protein
MVNRKAEFTDKIRQCPVIFKNHFNLNSAVGVDADA